MSSNGPESTSTYDYIVIGAGSGGLASARKAASYGAKVVIIEQSAIGGTCVNAGCIPKKIMYNAAEIATHLKLFPCYGFGSVGLRVATPSLLASEVEASLETSSMLTKSRKHHHEHPIDKASSHIETQGILNDETTETIKIKVDKEEESEEVVVEPSSSSRRRKADREFHIPDGKQMMSELTSLQKKFLMESDIDTPVNFVWEDLKVARDDYVRRLHGIYTASLAREKIEFIHDRATLIGTGQVQLEGSGRVLQGKNILLATGGHPKVPEGIPGSELGITSDDFFSLENQPQRVAIVGAGYIATELAGILRSFGSQVHLWCRDSTILRHFDATLSERLHEEMIHSGVLLQPFVTVKSVKKVTGPKEELSVTLVKMVNHEKLQVEIRVDAIIWAIGRAPRTDQLGLDKLGVHMNEQGLITVNDMQETSVANIFAVGDIIDRPHLTPVAIAAGRKLADRLFGGKKNAVVDYRLVPTVIFSHPPIATIGLSEAEARSEHGSESVKVYSSRFTSLYYGLLPPGHRDRHLTFYKLVVFLDGQDKEGEPIERVVGIHMIGQGSDEILQGFAVAMRKGLTKADLDNTIAIHPTSAEELVTMR